MKTGARISIQIKITSVIILALFLTILAVLFFTVSEQREGLLTAADNTLTMNTDMLYQSLRAIMLNGEAELAVRTMTNLQMVQGVEAIGLYRVDGSIAFHDYETLEFVNSYQKVFTFKRTERVAKTVMDTQGFRRVMNTNAPLKIENREMEKLEYYFPLINTAECRSCHSPNHFLRGIVHMRISISSVYREIEKARRILTVIFIIAGGISAWVLIFALRHIVIKPLSRIGVALLEVGKGNLSVAVSVPVNDELGEMADWTNYMIESLKKRTEEIEITQDVTILSLASLAETRDNETGDHILRTQHYIKVLAEELSQRDTYKDQLNKELITLLYKSAPLHDIGKVGIPDAILLKPASLSDEEWKVMRRHPAFGHEALKIAEEKLGSTSFLRLAREITLTHHERWDGTGYPRKLAGETIPLSGRLMALGDVYDALISRRTYKPAFSHGKARAVIIESKGSHFDPEVVEAFIAREGDFIAIAKKFSPGPGQE